MALADTDTIGYAWGLLLGLIQGLTEFLPVSSSGHLALAGHLGRNHPQNVALDLLLHLATMLVVAEAFWRDLLAYWRQQRIIIAYLAAGTIPAVIVGMLFRHELTALRDSPMMICTALIITAISLVIADRAKTSTGSLGQLGYFGSLVIGICQALAIVPGISRSGSTIAAGTLCGLQREDAVKFSFLLMVPVVFGASLLKLIKEPQSFAALTPGPCAVAFAATLVSGYFALKILMRLVRQQKLTYFAVYCAVIAIAGFVYFGIIK